MTSDATEEGKDLSIRKHWIPFSSTYHHHLDSKELLFKTLTKISQQFYVEMKGILTDTSGLGLTEIHTNPVSTIVADNTTDKTSALDCALHK